MTRDREQRTIQAMIEIYCDAHHDQQNELCVECQQLYEYALARLGKCPFGAEKPVCANCTIHCYRNDMRSQIKTVMRYAGPRMALRHPGLAVAHLLQKHKSVPQPPTRQN